MQQVIEVAGQGRAAVLRLGKAPLPQVGPRQVLIRVEAAGVNRADVLQKRGLYPVPEGASPILGLEVAGTVAALGEGVTAFRQGDAVMALLDGGGYSQYAVAEAAQCLPIPSGMAMDAAASLPEALFTVWLSLMMQGGLRPGDVVLVQGGGSGIGVMAIQLLKALGHTVFVTAGSDDKCARCLTLGADRAINYRTHDFASELGDASVDVVLDMVAGDYTPRHLRVLKRDGRLVVIAFQGGAVSEVDMRQVLMKRLSIIGTTLRSRSDQEKAQVASQVRERVWPLLASGAVRPVVDRVFPMQDAEFAHEWMEKSFHFGKIVLQISR